MIWEQISSNRTRSIILVTLMAIVLMAIGYALGIAFLEDGLAGLILAMIVWLIMLLIAYFQGDNILLSVSNARKIGPDDHPRLYNIVEEMKIASGLENMPDIYIIDDPSPNAFATGRNPKKAAVAVTSGLLQRLNRDELQGVIAHELSHINNRDVLLMAICAVMLGTIVMLSYYGSRLLFLGGAGRSRRSTSTGGGGQLIIFLIVLVFMILAPIMSQLIYFAISRRREYLADASAALYTRYPEGLASALEKIASSTEKLRSANKATAPMYISDPFKADRFSIDKLTSTHPPIQDRIRILRSMSGVSYSDYNLAYKQIKGSGIIPKSALEYSQSFSMRTAVHPENNTVEELERARETSDLLWRLNQYNTVDCECGTRFRIPPGFKASEFVCPHCGRINKVNKKL